jgi:hypothetical protein
LALPTAEHRRGAFGEGSQTHLLEGFRNPTLVLRAWDTGVGEVLVEDAGHGAIRQQAEILRNESDPPKMALAVGVSPQRTEVDTEHTDLAGIRLTDRPSDKFD